MFFLKKSLFTLGMICFGFVLGLIICEITLRLVVHFEILGSDNTFIGFLKKIEANPVTNSIYIESKELGIELKPNSRSKFIRINSAGFRGGEYSQDVPPGVKRIAVIGDSETFGAFLKEHETLSGALERSLNGMVGNQQYGVLNFGVPGYNTFQEFRLLQSKAIFTSILQ
jgi:hypothetical protein